MESYIKIKKSDWFKYLKIYHSLFITRLKGNHLIKRLRSDYESELKSYKIDKRISKEKITFKSFTPYFQEQNKVFKKIRKTIMNMT